MPSVFLCHSSKDKPFARQLASLLKSYGIHVWIDEAEIRVGESLTKTVGAAIQESDFVAAILSKNSINSEWVQRELQVALKREFAEKKVIVLPILLNKVKVPPFLSDKLYADFTAKAQLDRGYAQLLRAVGVSSEHLVGLPPQSFIFHALHHTIKMMDSGGRKAIWEKQTTATPLRPDISLWRDEQYYGTGNLKFIKSEPGFIEKVERQGNIIAVSTRFDPPPEANTIFARTLYVEADDCFTKDHEDFSWVLLGSFEEFGIHIILPDERPFKEVPASHYMISTQDYPLEQGKLSAGMTKFDLLVERPIQGARYLIQWHW